VPLLAIRHAIRAASQFHQSHIMPRTLYSPPLSDDVVRALYQEGQLRQMPMTRLADQLLRQALIAAAPLTIVPNPPVSVPIVRHIA
jgi:hypothetical protein